MRGTESLTLSARTAGELGSAIRTGETCARDLIEDRLDTIVDGDRSLHTFLHLDADAVRRRADEIDEQVAEGRDPGPLAGVPVAIKDNLCTRGVPTTCASRILAGWTPPYDATVVRRVLDAGAIVFAKTNMDEFGMGSSTENSAFGPTRNPHDVSRVPGGSSGGSAAAVSAGYAPLALGSDTGGSIRQPASLCGVVGVKPTYGRVSRHGLVAFASSLDQVGVLAADVADAALLLEVVAGHDPLDSTSVPEPVPAYGAGLGRGVEGRRVGIIREMLTNGISPFVTERVRAAAGVLEAAGAVVDEVSLPAVEYGLSAYYLIAPAEASSNLARFDGVRYGLRVDGATAASMQARTRAAGFGAEVKRRIMLGTYALSAGYYDAYYDRACRVRTLICRDYQNAFDRFDVLLGPVTPTTAFRFGERADPFTMYQFDVCTVSVNLAGLPAVSVPFGTDQGGLPVGVQLIGPVLGEEECLQAAWILEQGVVPAR